jgi:hypothetical protein
MKDDGDGNEDEEDIEDEVSCLERELVPPTGLLMRNFRLRSFHSSAQ